MTDRFLLLFLLFSTVRAASQESQGKIFFPKDSVIIQATRLPSDASRVAMSVSSLEWTKLRPVFQNFSVNEYLQTIPGVFVMNSRNYAQDLRLSIRGFGSRAAFGIRGVKLIVDGIPETTPDGQGQVDNLLVGAIRRMEIIRGPASSLYGNASGGVLSISTDELWEQSFLQAGLNLGSFGTRRYELSGGVKWDKTDLLIRGVYSHSDGFRNQSAVKNGVVDARITHRLNSSSTWKWSFNYTDSPTADDPGALTIEEAKEDRASARERNVIFNTGESISQWRLGTHYEWRGDREWNVNAYGFLSRRDFYGLLPFEFGGVVDLSRIYFGAGVHLSRNYILQNAVFTWMSGVDFADQRDDRLRYLNLNGAEGMLNFDQLESFTNAAVFVIGRLAWKSWLVSTGLRYDRNHLSADDHFLADGDQSGYRDMNAFNPSLGVSYQATNDWTFFANFSTSFETPSLSELSASPTGRAGFNESLLPQEAENIEIGVRAQILDRLSAEASLFRITTQMEIVPFEVAAFPDREFFRNAGESRRYGLEFNGSFSLSPSWIIRSMYTLSDFNYENYKLGNRDLKGNELPGIPRHMGSLQIEHAEDSGFTFLAQARFVGQMYGDDSNAVKIDPFTEVNIKAGYGLFWKGWRIFPNAGINNLLNATYFDNIRINAFGGRHYEPAPGINGFFGISFRRDKNGST